MYRTWIHATKDVSNMWNSDELCRDLRTALGTAKWQVIPTLHEYATKIASSFGIFCCSNGDMIASLAGNVVRGICTGGEAKL